VHEEGDVSGLMGRIAALFGGSAREQAGAPPAPEPADAPAPPALSADDPRLPDTARPRVARLLAIAADVEARGARDALLVTAVTEIRQMRDRHLPQLVASYAEIPPAHRAEIFRATGRSASYNLDEALERMIAKAEAISRALAQEDINSFAANLRFINQRYGAADPFA
jgi:hypothetical protein